MAAIAQSDQYQIFMRKIGYSVGLEQSFDRIVGLADTYIAEGQVPLSAWQKLVHEKWKLKNDNVGDFFHALGLINRSKTKIDALSGLDLVSVLRAQFQSDEGRPALIVAFLSLLIEHDGEIFLNCLAAEFQDDVLVTYLEDLVSYKRKVLFDIFRAPELQAQLARTVGIDRQITNIGGAGKSKSLSETKRTAPLEKRTDSLKGPAIQPVVISEDYLRKVPPRRRDWASSVGLYSSDAGLSQAGRALLDNLAASRLRLESGAVVLWPFSHEISRFRINPTVFENRIVDYWTLVSLAVVGAGGSLKENYDDDDRRLMIDAAIQQIGIYRSLNRPKAMLRREYPLTVAFLTLAAAFLVAGKAVPNIPKMVDDEKKADSSPLEIRSSRNSIGALALR